MSIEITLPKTSLEKFQDWKENGEKKLAVAQSMQVTNDEEAAVAADAKYKLTKSIKEVNSEKDLLKRPHLDFNKSVDKITKESLAPLEEAKKILTKKNSDYVAEQERKNREAVAAAEKQRQEDLQKAQEEKGEDLTLEEVVSVQSDVSPIVPEVVKPKGMRCTIKHEVVSPDQVPRELCVPCDKKIREYIRNNPEVNSFEGEEILLNGIVFRKHRS